VARVLACLLAGAACVAHASTDEVEKAKPMSTNRGAQTSEEAFRRGYSTAPVSVALEGHEYAIPMNYLTAFGDQPAKSTPRYVTMAVFLPDFAGFREDNYRDPFDKRKITVSWGGAFGGSPPGEQLASLQQLGVAKQPHEQRHGLAVYRGQVAHESWFLGERADGESLLLRCRAEAPAQGVVNALCEARYPNARNGYGLSYRFSAEHLPKWREIDEQINRLIMSWRIR
jgi:hypothetical protein